jgi:hypothetical protein
MKKKVVREFDNLIPHSKFDELNLCTLSFWTVKSRVDDNDMVDVNGVILNLMRHIDEIEKDILKIKYLVK